MASTTKTSFTNPAFLVHQSQKLQALLTKAMQESASAITPEASIDLSQLTEILSSLLEEAQFYSILSSEELQRRQNDVHTFMRRFKTIESAMGDWDLRLASQDQPISRKRSRTLASDEPSKNPRSYQDGQNNRALRLAPVFAGPYSEMIPLAAYDARETEWWNEPYYD